MLKLPVLRFMYVNQFERAVAEAGLKTTQGLFGVAATGYLDEKVFAEQLAVMPEGTWEMLCHPGYNDADLDKVQTRLRASREIERKLLTSPDTRKALEARGIQLINFAEL